MSVCRMSEPTVAPMDPAKRKSKTFGKQLSKGFQKGKEVMKRGLLTPRGARAQEKPAAEGLVGKATGANPNIPKAPASTTDPVSPYPEHNPVTWPNLFKVLPGDLLKEVPVTFAISA